MSKPRLQPLAIAVVAALLASATAWPANDAVTSHKITSGNMSSEYLDQGSGPLVVLLAVNADRSAAPETLDNTLSAAGFRVLRPVGLPAAPAAAAARVVAVLDAVAAGPAVLVAEGESGFAARRAALDRPELVRGLVFAGEPARPNDVSSWDTPAAAALRLVRTGEVAAPATEAARRDWGTRLTVNAVPGASDALLRDRTREVAAATIAWLRGPALSSTQPGARIAAPEDVSQMSPEQREMSQGLRDSLNTEAGRRVGVVGPRAVLLHDTRLLKGYLGFGDVMATAPVPLRYKELAILVTARAFDSDYEWVAHERPALNAGVPPAVVAAIKVGRTPSFEQAADRIVYDFASEIHRDHHVSDATYQKAWDLLGTNGLVNLTMVIGHYMNVATTLNVHELPLPAGAQRLPPRERN